MAAGKCLRKTQAIALALINTANAAFQPNWLAMKAVSQFQVDATISTGGAA